MVANQASNVGEILNQDVQRNGSRGRLLPYERWMQSQGIPIHRGHYIEDLRTVDVGWWPERECNAAFLYFTGQEGVKEARLTEIPPGKTLPALKLTVDEVVYVLEGRGLTTIRGDDKQSETTFEWQKRSLFLLPRGSTHQFSNAQGDRPARLLHNNFLPVAMSLFPDPEFFFNNPGIKAPIFNREAKDFYSAAKVIQEEGADGPRSRAVWVGNFFPDMLTWDKLIPFWGRGAGGMVVWINFAGSDLTAAMSEFPVGTYRKGHRHGPGRVIVIPGGEGYSVMWQEGKEKVVVPWHEGSVFSPPEKWFHQHFNLGGTPARYLRPVSSGSMPQFAGRGERVEDASRDQIEYPDEDPWIRQTFESELAKRGLKSLMPDQAYKDPNFEWEYGDSD